MNIPKIILLERKIISSDVYHYYQSLAQRLIMKKRNSEVNIISNYSKEKILNWFSYLDIKQKFKICSIYNNWFSNIIFQMMEYSHFEPVIEFFPTDVYQEFKKYNLDEYSYLKNELNEITNNEKNIYVKNYDDFITFFRGENKVKKSSGVPNDYELININYKFHNENLFFAGLRFITLDEFNDTITFSKDILNHPERLFEFFNYFSKNQCFNSVITPIQEKNNLYNFSFPNWIYNYQSYSFCQLLLIFFEQIISVYYQLYLYEKEIPQFNIDQKFSEFFKTNESVKNYLSEKIKNIKDNSIVDKQKCLDLINSKSQLEKYIYYENKTKLVYSFAFGFSLYEHNLDKKREFNLKFFSLMELAKKNYNDFIDKITFIEAKDSFKYLNFIFYVIYQQLIEQCSNECYQELLIEEQNKTQNEPVTLKSKKNKRKKKKKKKSEKVNKEIKNQSNNNIEDYNQVEEEKDKDIIQNNEEEIEEIPADYIIQPKTEQNLKEFESTNINIINNDINNSTVSSSYTNKYSKDYNNISLGPRYNNFFKCEKKESEMLLEIKDFSDDKSEESNDQKEKNDKIELEDISENDISEENINNNITINIDDANKPKKKKHKKRNKKKKNKNSNENNNEIDNNNNINSINNQIKDKNNLIEKLENKDEKIKTNKQDEPKILENKDEKIKINKHDEPKILVNNDDKENINKEIKEKSDINEIKEQSNNYINSEIKNIQENISINEEKKIKEHSKGDKEKYKRKNNKEFFLFPVNNTKKKEKNVNQKKKEKPNSNIIIEVQKESNLNLNNKNKKNEENKTKTNNNVITKKVETKIIQSENYSNNKLNPFEINKVANIIINSDKKHSKEEKKDNNALLFLNQPTIQNPLFYGNYNNSFFVFQNELFTILGKDILNFQKGVENNLKEINIYREKIIDKYKKYILKILSNNYNIEFLFYGSYSTGLSIESSDIDILIKFAKKEKVKENESNSEKNIHDLIFLLNEEFNKSKEELKIVNINPIYTASIPVLKIECQLKDMIPIDVQNKLSEKYLFNFESELLKLNFDFTFLEVEDIHKEIKIPSQEIIKLIQDYINLYPNIKSIILVLKRYMQIKKLNSSYHGGISSFSLFLLMACYNQQLFNENKLLEKNKDFEYLLGQVFYGFFMFYANFNFKIHSIEINKNNPFILLNEFNENKITLIDPITGLNAAKSTFRIEQIKWAFNNAIIIINDIFYKNMNYIDNDNKDKDIIIKLLTSHNLNNYFY